MDRNTVRKYLRIAEGNGFGGGFQGDLDEIAYLVFKEVHPDRREELEEQLQQLRAEVVKAEKAATALSAMSLSCATAL